MFIALNFEIPHDHCNLHIIFPNALIIISCVCEWVQQSPLRQVAERCEIIIRNQHKEYSTNPKVWHTKQQLIYLLSQSRKNIANELIWASPDIWRSNFAIPILQLKTVPDVRPFTSDAESEEEGIGAVDPALCDNSLSAEELNTLQDVADATRLAARITDTPANIMDVDKFIEVSLYYLI